ncbi:MAG: hypothetical protein ACP5UM_06990, partial [Anaerolineae bacterium]
MLEMVAILGLVWLAVGVVLGLILQLTQNLNRFQVALSTWVLGSLLLAGGAYWVLSQDPVPLAWLQRWREEVVRQVAADRAVLLEEIPHAQMRVARFLRLDADGDRELEWVVVYSRQGSAGVRAYVFDSDVGTPGVLYPYPLQTPSEDYLGDAPRGLHFHTEDVVNLGRPQLVVWDQQTLSIFKVNQRPADAADMVRGTPPRYEVIGFFRGDQVQRQGARVTVWQRAPMERSYLAVRRVYEPDPVAKTYFRPGTFDLREPVEESIGFMPQRPSDILDSPYPEAIVVAFYSDVPKDEAQEYLVPALRDAYLNGTLDYGSPWPRADLARFLIREVRYRPPDPGAAQATVTVAVVPLRVGQPAAGAPAPVLVQWTL